MNVRFQGEEAGYDAIRLWLSQRCGIAYPDHKRDLLMQRLSRVQRAFAYDALSDLADALVGGRSTDLQLAVMHAASTNHTFFFREMDVLNHFRTQVLPGLGRRHEIRLWSAAASTGDEVYTLAILIAETLGMEALSRTAILGTDISAPVIDFAERGIYTERHLQQVPGPLRDRYFRPVGIGQFQVIPQLRAVATFRRMNLKSTPYPFRHHFQAVFCRNILYYFDREDQIATLRAIHDVAEPGGFLFTSVTESVRDLPTPWKTTATGVHRKAAS